MVCNNARLIGESVIGQPTEGALQVLAKKTSLDVCQNNYERIREIPFTHETKWMAVQCQANVSILEQMKNKDGCRAKCSSS